MFGICALHKLNQITKLQILGVKDNFNRQRSWMAPVCGRESISECENSPRQLFSLVSAMCSGCVGGAMCSGCVGGAMCSRCVGGAMCSRCAGGAMSQLCLLSTY